MQRQTNLDAIKSVALQFLDYTAKEVGERESRHNPFARAGCDFIEEGTPAFDEWKADKKKSIEHAETAWEVCFMLGHDWFIRFLLAIESYLSEDEFTKIFMHHFRFGSYCGSEDVDNGNTNIVDCFKKCNRALIMNEDEQKFYDRFLDDFPMYCGTPVDSPEEIGKVFLWFYDEIGARELIRDGSGYGDIYSATIDKEHLLAFIGSEKSVYDSGVYIVDPQHLKSIEFVESYDSANDDEDDVD